MVIPDFKLARVPYTIFAAGSFSALPDMIGERGQRVLILTGGNSLVRSGNLDLLLSRLKQSSISYFTAQIKGEPSPVMVDDIVSQYREQKIDSVTAIGGGSVIDAGKAVSAMLPRRESVADYLEGVGHKMHDGSKIPYIAVPTTSGTGSEATKNAVLSTIGTGGYKKSLRHDNFVPDAALIDPELTLSCPADVTAACGMDAFTQLLESYLSPKSSPVTDSLAISGLLSATAHLVDACGPGSKNVPTRAAMAYAAYISGITLANAGLAVVHGLASPIGGFFDIPHGVVCGTLIGSATRKNINLLKNLDGQPSLQAVNKYANVGRLISGNNNLNVKNACNELIRTIEAWTEKLKIPKLGMYGFNKMDVAKIVKVTGIKENPVPLNTQQISDILMDRI